MNFAFDGTMPQPRKFTMYVGVLAVLLGLTGPSNAEETKMEDHIIGIGGVFVRADDQDAMKAWYGDNLGIDAGQYGKNFMWRHADDPETPGRTVWSLFNRDSTYFEGPYMINYMVRDMDGLLAKLEEKGIEQLKPREDYEYGSFAWIKDPEGRWIELWEPIEKGFDEE